MTKKQEVTYLPKVIMRFVLSPDAIVRHLRTHENISQVCAGKYGPRCVLPAGPRQC